MKSTVKKALIDTIPVLTGYLVLGFGFGIIMKSAGYGILLSLAMSLLIYAGSMQYATIGLFGAEASLITIAVTTLMVNARHIFYGISMLDKYKGMGWKKIYLVFGLCDESFSINFTADIPDDVDRGYFMFWVTALNQSYWVCAATIGGLLGELIRFDTFGIEFVMTAMFVVIFLEHLLKEKIFLSAAIGLFASISSLLFFGADKFLIPTMLMIIALLSLFRKPIDKQISLSSGGAK